MEGCDDGCAALVSCPLTKTLISVCVIPHCLLRLLILINYIHLPLPPSIPFSHPPSLCPPKITYDCLNPTWTRPAFTYSLSLFPWKRDSLPPFLPATRFYSPFRSILLPYVFFCHLMSLSLFSSYLTLKKLSFFYFVLSLLQLTVLVLGRRKSLPTQVSLQSHVLWRPIYSFRSLISSIGSRSSSDTTRNTWLLQVSHTLKPSDAHRHPHQNNKPINSAVTLKEIEDDTRQPKRGNVKRTHTNYFTKSGSTSAIWGPIRFRGQLHKCLNGSRRRRKDGGGHVKCIYRWRWQGCWWLVCIVLL